MCGVERLDSQIALAAAGVITPAAGRTWLGLSPLVQQRRSYGITTFAPLAVIN